MINQFRKAWLYLPSIIILMLSGGCTSMTKTMKTVFPNIPNGLPSNSIDSPCIPPVVNIAYPVDIPKSLNGESNDIFPLGDWKFEANLPEESNGSIPQIITKSQEVWVLSDELEYVYSYSTETKKWEGYNTIENVSAVPRSLFLSKDETIWGFGVSSSGVDANDKIPLISRYNENSDQFEFVTDIDGVLLDLRLIRIPPNVSEGQDGLLWFFGSRIGDIGVGLYSFNPSSLKVEKWLYWSSNHSYTGPVVSPEGLIWYFQGDLNNQHLHSFSHDTEEIQTYYGIPDFERVGRPINLYFDHEGRLWADNKGWLDFENPDNPVWYEIIPNPVFLTDQGAFHPDTIDGSISKYGFSPSVYISQSSNGWLWVTTFHGTIRLDLEEGIWCKFTTGSSPVVEDGEGYVWIVIFDKLYKYQLSQ
jgi:hypothetical protein